MPGVLLDGVNSWQNVLLALSKCHLVFHPTIRSSLDRVETQELLFPLNVVSKSTGQFSPFPLGLFQTLVGAVNVGYSCETSVLLLLSIIRRLGALRADRGASEQLRLDAGPARAQPLSAVPAGLTSLSCFQSTSRGELSPQLWSFRK